ncbi:Hypothetical protein NTJ_05865 [Nesidiocoris tenuis]|uniref:Uncharacterized protein n=1 Tax=Nesidiocoris tenuis TaxID=355587 RepID=A0ABN7ALD8_9HEMI|nr:Hypothetical protein NTJ_05865 [Nesidiocoris tenuis]
MRSRLETNSAADIEASSRLSVHPTSIMWLVYPHTPSYIPTLLSNPTLHTSLKHIAVDFTRVSRASGRLRTTQYQTFTIELDIFFCEVISTLLKEQ